MEKQGIEKVLEKLRSIRLSDGHFDSTGEYDDELLEHIIRSAIETSFKEVRPERKEYSTPEKTVNSLEHRRIDGFNDALSNYDQAVDKYLGK